MLQAADSNNTAEEAQMKRVVNILVQIQKQVESNVGLEHVRQPGVDYKYKQNCTSKINKHINKQTN